MAGRINDEDVKAVRDAVPIDAVVSEYLQLRNAGGGNLKGLCPFHDEKSPSFQVSPSKGLFHCFGCQEGGDTITFVMKVDHLSFSEAVERLAAQAGITLRYEEGGYNPASQRGERIRLVEVAEFPEESMDGNESKLADKIAVLGGCAAVYCLAVGGSAVRQLLAAGVQPIRVDDEVGIETLLDGLRRSVREGGVVWIDRALKRDADTSRFDRMAEEGWQE